MKKLFSMAGAVLFVCSNLMAGGLVTNTNQSAMFTRMQCRDATLGVDAVYFNPAGLTKLQDGFHLSLNNQTIGQTKTVTSNYQFLNNAPESSYEGTVSAPLFPGIYAVYKTGKLALSVGFNPIGGGGGAEFATGLPSFEMMIADLVPSLQAQLAPLDAGIEAATNNDPGFRNITGYNADIYFEGSSVYMGYQANASYQINDMISVGLGVRYVTAKDSYKGSIKDITINAPAPHGTQTAGDYFRILGIIMGGLNPTAAAQLNGTAPLLDGLTADKEVDVEFTGSGITPIISLNLAASENLNIAFKYEHKTNLEMTAKVNGGNDGGGLYVDGEKSSADMPSQLSLGVMYKPMPKLMVTTGIHYYLDTDVDYDGIDTVEIDMIDNNFIEFGLGLNYELTEKLCISGGWLTTLTGVNDNYQNDLTYSLPSNSFGGGVGYVINEMIDLSLGASYTMFKEGSKTYNHSLGAAEIPTTETYQKNAWIIALGLNFHFGR